MIVLWIIIVMHVSKVLMPWKEEKWFMPPPSASVDRMARAFLLAEKQCRMRINRFLFWSCWLWLLERESWRVAMTVRRTNRPMKQLKLCKVLDFTILISENSSKWNNGSNTWLRLRHSWITFCWFWLFLVYNKSLHLWRRPMKDDGLGQQRLIVIHERCTSTECRKRRSGRRSLTCC